MTLARLDRSHGASLFRAYGDDEEQWRYMSYGPFRDEADCSDWCEAEAKSHDPYFFAILPKDIGAPAGVAALMRIDAQSGVIEIGSISFGSDLKQSKAATEAIYLAMKWAFEAGYRRFEWKCDSANMPSRRAAIRFGFSYEGTFRQHMIIKGLNRDTAWFACVDTEWPSLREAYESWLSPDNFDEDGRQKSRLRDLTAPIVKSPDPI